MWRGLREREDGRKVSCGDISDPLFVCEDVKEGVE